MFRSLPLQRVNILRFPLYALLFALCISCTSDRQIIPFAVASSLAPLTAELAQAYTRTHAAGEIHPTLASSGVLYAQIARDAPYAAAIFADERISAAAAELKPHRRYKCFAGAQLALWAPAMAAEDSPEELLQYQGVRILIPDPQIAPAGAAARKLLQRLGVAPARLIPVGSASHTVRLALKGAGDLAVVPQPLLLAARRHGQVSGVWTVPERDCCHLTYQAVLLQDGETAAALYRFLTGSQVADILRQAGFVLPGQTPLCTADAETAAARFP